MVLLRLDAEWLLYLETHRVLLLHLMHHSSHMLWLLHDPWSHVVLTLRLAHHLGRVALLHDIFLRSRSMVVHILRPHRLNLDKVVILIMAGDPSLELSVHVLAQIASPMHGLVDCSLVL